MEYKAYRAVYLGGKEGSNKNDFGYAGPMIFEHDPPTMQEYDAAQDQICKIYGYDGAVILGLLPVTYEEQSVVEEEPISDVILGDVIEDSIPGVDDTIEESSELSPDELDNMVSGPLPEYMAEVTSNDSASTNADTLV